MNNCPKCGAQLTPGDDFCKMCGTKIGGNQGTAPVNNGYNPGVVNPPQANYFPPQKQANPNIKYICITVAVIVLVLGGIFITNKLLANKTDNPDNPGNNNNIVNPTPSPDVANVTKMRYGDFTLSVPNNIKIEEVNGNLVLYVEGDWSVKFAIYQNPYSVYKANMATLKTQLIQSGYTDVKDFEVKTISEREVLFTTAVNTGYLDHIGIMQVANRFSGIFEAFNDASPATPNMKMLDSIVGVIKTIEYDPSTKNLEGEDILNTPIVINGDELTEEGE